MLTTYITSKNMEEKNEKEGALGYSKWHVLQMNMKRKDEKQTQELEYDGIRWDKIHKLKLKHWKQRKLYSDK